VIREFVVTTVCPMCRQETLEQPMVAGIPLDLDTDAPPFPSGPSSCTNPDCSNRDET
jgi:hypothetical protein